MGMSGSPLAKIAKKTDPFFKYNDILGLGADPAKNTAAEAAAKAEAERQAAIKEAQSRVNAVFDSPERQADIDRAIAAQREFETGILNQKKSDTDRQLKFALARNGQVGGSTQVDQQRRFGQDYANALLGVERSAQGFGANIRSADQDARARLISLATAGLDATTGEQQAAEAMRVNLQAGNANRNAEGVANAFVNFNDFLKSSRERADRQRADRVAGFNYYQPTSYGGGF